MRYSVSRKGYSYKNYCCKKCGETDPVNFYGAKKTECKICFNKRSVARRKTLKQKAVDFLGGKCESCGYDKYIGALEFHHRDPTEKEIQIAGTGKKWETIKEELKKCSLLCANCHREKHQLERFKNSGVRSMDRT